MLHLPCISIVTYLKIFQQYAHVTILKILIKSNYKTACFGGGQQHHQGSSEDFALRPLGKQQNGYSDMLYTEGRICGYQRFVSMTNGLPGAKDNKWLHTNNESSASLFIISNLCIGVDRQ
jgi:hypothetical protein